MNDLLIGYSVTLTFVCVLGGLFCVYRYYLGNRMIDQAAKLKSQIAKIRQDFPNLEQKSSGIVANALGDIGIDGILDELGVPSVFKPLAKGFIQNLMEHPEKVQAYAEKLGIKLSEGENEQKSEGNSLL